VQSFYRRTAGSGAPAAVVSTVEQRAQDDYVPTGWTTSPSGTTSALRFEWRIERSGSAGVWTEFTVPTRFSYYGKDGDGVQFVFQRTADETTPATPVSTTEQRADDDYVPVGWTQTSLGITEALPFEWVSERRGTAGDWGEFSAAAVFARRGADGAQGRPGETREYIYRRTTTASRPPTPPSSQQFRWRFGTIPNAVENALEGPNPTAAQLQAALDSPDVAEVTPQFLDNQNRPVAGPDFSAVTGIGFEWDGSAHPDDHTHWNLFFATTATLPIIADFFANFLTYTNTTWSEGRIYLIDIGANEAKRIDDADGNTWTIYYHPLDFTTFPTNAVRSILFEQLNTNIFGRAAAAAAGAAYTTDDYVPTNWTDDPTGPDATNQWEWISERKGISGAWGDFSTPKLWSKYGAQGDTRQYWYQPTTVETKPADLPATAAWRSQDAPTIPNWSTGFPGLSDVNRFIWQTYRDGRPGLWRDFTPVTLANRQGRDGEQGVATEAREFYPYSYRMSYDSRLGTSTPAATTRTWSEWAAPTLYRHITFNNDAFPENTDTLQSVYRLSNSQTPPSITNSTSDSFTPANWSRTRNLPTSTNRYLHRAQRTRTSTTATWGNFNTPTIIATYNNGTSTTTTDSNNRQIIFTTTPNSEIPDTPPPGGLTQRTGNTEFIPTDWLDNPPTPTWDNPYTFFSTRTSSLIANRETPDGNGQYQLIYPNNATTVNQATEIWLSNTDLDASSPRELYNRLQTGDLIAISNSTDTVREEFIITDIINQSEPNTGPITQTTGYIRIAIQHTNTQKGTSSDFPIPPLLSDT